MFTIVVIIISIVINAIFSKYYLFEKTTTLNVLLPQLGKHPVNVQLNSVSDVCFIVFKEDQNS